MSHEVLKGKKGIVTILSRYIHRNLGLNRKVLLVEGLLSLFVLLLTAYEYLRLENPLMHILCSQQCCDRTFPE
jgi:hypothetical protein